MFADRVPNLQWSRGCEHRPTSSYGPRLASDRPYALDTIVPPFDNPWKSLLFFGGQDFFSDGKAMLGTMQGDVWRVEGLDDKLGRVRWRRFASGLSHALGLVIVRSQSPGRGDVRQEPVYVQGRDQITRLHDLNGDAEADFYECFSNAYVTSPAGHDFICGLERDPAGNFYTVSGNQGLLRISPDGRRAQVLATGFRNPHGLGLLPDGSLTVPCSEGEWTPASMVCLVRPTGTQGSGPRHRDQPSTASTTAAAGPPHYGYKGPQNGRPPELPLVYLPRGLDNSSAAQVYVSSGRWGPLQGQLVHFSYGAGSHFLLLRDEVAGQVQGAVVPLPGEFLAGPHRGRFSPKDGQLYVTAMGGWGTYTALDGSFQRVRYTGEPVQLPLAFHAHSNGIRVTFSLPVDRTIAEQPKNHFAQAWNYRYSAGYGSAEFSARHPGTPGHDPLTIASAHVLHDGLSLFLEIPDLQPVNQLHLHLRVGPAAGGAQPTQSQDRPVDTPINPVVAQDLFVTVHKLDAPFTDFAGYRPTTKQIAAHPMLADLALAAKAVPNPWRKRLPDARTVTMEAAKNLTFATRSFNVRAGEPIQLTFKNPDVVPHNWVLIKPGTLARVGDLANKLVADPEAVVHHYVPRSNDVLLHTDVVPPQSSFTVYFHAPAQRGRYPYLCTFPGHWMVMNGQMIVE